MSQRDVVGTDDQQKQDEKRKDENLAQAQSYADVTKVLAMPEGRRALYRVLQSLGSGVTLQGGGPMAYVDAGPLDVNSTLVNLGAILVAEELKFAWMIASPADFSQMMTDATFDQHKQHEESVRKKKKLERQLRAHDEQSLDDEDADEDV